MNEPIIFSPGLHKQLGIDELEKLTVTVRDIVNSQQEEVLFCPYPPSTDEEKSQKVKITLFEIKSGIFVMILPLQMKKRNNEKAWCVLLKDEYGKIELDIQHVIKEGQHRRSRK